LQQIKSIPNGGVGFYFIRDYLKNEYLRSSYFNFMQEGDVFLNYFGRVDAIAEDEQYEVVLEDTGVNGYTMELQNFLLQCLVGIRENQLFLKMVYSDVYLKASTIEKVLDEMKTMLREIVSEQIIEKIA
jgi:non-ribosomal peptide synthase protein (TIGR01720 family)